MGTIRNIRKYEKKAEKQFKKRIVKHQKEVSKIIDATIEDVGKQIHLLQSKQKLEPKKFISQIKRNKLIQKQLKQAQKDLYNKLNTTIKNQTTDEWQKAIDKEDKIESIYLGEGAIATKLNTEALNAFVNRKIKGITLSDRLWSASKTAQSIFEEHIGTGITQGKSSKRIVKDLMETFKDPNALLRSPRFKGQYKNVRSALDRLVITETNGAYRRSDVFRMQKMDFVIGYITHLSASRDPDYYDICDSFSEAKWPKTFIFSGFHPNCRCYVTSILQNKSDFRNKVPTNYITKTPIQMDRLAKTYGKTTMRNNPLITDNYNKNMDLLRTSGTRRKIVKPYKNPPITEWTKIKKK